MNKKISAEQAAEFGIPPAPPSMMPIMRPYMMPRPISTMTMTQYQPMGRSMKMSRREQREERISPTGSAEDVPLASHQDVALRARQWIIQSSFKTMQKERKNRVKSHPEKRKVKSGTVTLKKMPKPPKEKKPTKFKREDEPEENSI